MLFFSVLADHNGTTTWTINGTGRQISPTIVTKTIDQRQTLRIR